MNASRRQFLKTAAATAVVAPNIISSHLWANKPSETINLGFIGIGKQSGGHLGFFLGQKDCRVLGLAEVAKVRRDHAMDRVNKKYGADNSCKTHNDFREVLADKRIDAVVIGTPDHWHAIPSIMAAQAKKDVYCEKPLTVTIHAALETLKAARRNNIVYQVGSQQRTEFGGHFRKAVECIRNGRVGKVTKVKIGVGNPAIPCDLPTEKKPEGIDWDMWSGAAPLRGFNHILCPTNVHGHFPQWRRYREYAGGGLSDMGAHHYDIAKWALDLDETGPTKIIPPKEKNSGLSMIFENGIEIIHEQTRDPLNDVIFYGSEGTLYVDRRGITADPKSAVDSPFSGKDWHLPDIGRSHRRNWIDCIRSRKRPVADVAYGAHTSILCSLGNLGYQLRRELEWDPAKYLFKNDKEANNLISRPGRGEWKLA
ncbi:MAG: Gfo/Idh/MocA family oxidoreductase [Verrucomicrobiota bacterium]|jgi:predicted dehydrogenase|nr:Gfo/Idh/MocA family oxidoreductase [Verrucomicrobiota bacterium]